MTLSWIRRVFFLTGTCLGVAAAAHACSLNPQPLPPGDTPDAASNTVGGGDAGGYFGAGGDSGAPLVSDGGPAGNDGSDGGAATPPEGGDAGDAGDGASDAAMDAPEDAPADAPTDGEEGGG
jgi:hypothetical protein